MTRRKVTIYLVGVGLVLALTLGWYAWAFMLGHQRPASGFSGQRAYADVRTQVAFGPRIPGTEGHAKEVQWLQAELVAAGWQVRLQEAVAMGHPIQNVIAYRAGSPPQFILGAHYDTRIYADRDPDLAKRTQPTPGANNGASGVAVLLELARALPADSPSIWLVFFDAEDDGRIPGWDWLLGSKAFVPTLTDKPKGMILVDMVGAANTTFYLDGSSDPAMRSSLWAVAAKLGYQDTFIPSVKYDIMDDHTSFLQAGIPAVDIIDIDDKYWLTTQDTPEHVAAHSLQMVGDVLETWLAQPNR